VSGSGLDALEAQLEQRLDAFLRANPAQGARLADQEARDRQERLLAERLQLRQQAERQRQALLQLAEEIRLWQQRIAKARAAGAADLATRAEAHVASLMERGRQRWDQLGELGRRHAELERELASPATAPDLEAAWSRFETGEELEELRRRLQR